MNVSKIKQKAFCKHEVFKITTQTVLNVSKARPCNPTGVYKAEEGYLIELTGKELEAIYKLRYGKPISKEWSTTMDTESILKYLAKNKAIPAASQYFIASNDFWTKVADVNGKLLDATIILYYREDFKLTKRTKKEQGILDKLNARKSAQTLNRMVVGDNLIKTLNDNGFECFIDEGRYSNGNPFITFSTRKSFNTLVKAAVEHYLNDIVLKELRCKIEIPKQKTTHCYNWNDELCYIGDIKLDLKGEQNEAKRSN